MLANHRTKISTMIKSAGHTKECKCFDCRLLRAKYAKEYRERVKVEGKQLKLYKHGLRCYFRGCRRKPCRIAGAKYHRQWRGAELQNLAMVKAIIERHTINGLARKANVACGTIRNIKLGKTKRIRQETERRILEAA